MSALELLSQMREVSTTTDEDGASIVAFLRRLGRQPDDMLRFFDRSATYSLHGRDAVTVASEYFRSSSCVRYTGAGEDRQPYLQINKKMGAEIIRAALLQQRRSAHVLTPSCPDGAHFHGQGAQGRTPTLVHTPRFTPRRRDAATDGAEPIRVK